MAERKGKKAKQTEEVQTVSYDVTLLSDDDLYLFNEGSHYRLHEKLGAHSTSVGGVAGTYFAVWAPSARQVSVIGEFNGWNKSSHQLRAKGQSGIWEGFIPGIGNGTLYKYYIISRYPNGLPGLVPSEYFDQDEAKEAMGIDWMIWGELVEAIPPKYTEFIGKQIREQI